MRLKVKLDATDKFVPFEYHGFLQGAIYHAMTEKQGDFFHDKGFGENRRYKMFVFSELIGKYTVSQGGLTFNDSVSFYISSVSSQMLNRLYEVFNQSDSLILGKTEFPIIEAVPVDDIHYNDSHEYTLTTISPIVTYKTDEHHFSTYFHPKSADFEASLQENLKRKYVALFNEDNQNEYFEIKKIIKYKNVMVKYKKNIFSSYTCTMKVKVSDQYLKLLMHTGLGAKNAAGFGMMKIL